MRRLLIRPGAIGDFLVSLPALQCLKADYTEVWCPSAVVPLVQFADCVKSLRASGIDRVGILEASDVMAALGRFDEIHSWYGTNRPEFRAMCSTLPFRFYKALPNDSQHAVDFYLDQVGQPPGAVPRLLLPPVLRRPYAVLHPFSGSSHKNWPLSRWHELAEILGARMPVQWCCGPEDSLPGAIVHVDLLHLAEWLSSARVFIGNDSGITHLAAASGTPAIALFGPSDPSIWAPRGIGPVTVLRADPLGRLLASTVAEAVP